MSDRMYLEGSDDVRRASNNMIAAADKMSQAAATMDATLDRHHRFLDDWLQRFEAVLMLGAGKPPPAPSRFKERKSMWKVEKGIPK